MEKAVLSDVEDGEREEEEIAGCGYRMESPINIFQSTFDCRRYTRRSGLVPAKETTEQRERGRGRVARCAGARREGSKCGRIYGSGMRGIARIASRRPDAILHY